MGLLHGISAPWHLLYTKQDVQYQEMLYLQQIKSILDIYSIKVVTFNSHVYGPGYVYVSTIWI